MRRPLLASHAISHWLVMALKKVLGPNVMGGGGGGGDAKAGGGLIGWRGPQSVQSEP